MAIALCIVVRNEALYVRACIESAAAHVDEVVLVDTGSTDGTPEIARAAGATVHELPWPGDLARAHDLPMELASEPWVLELDGDEMLDPDAGARIRGLVRDDEVAGYVFTVRNYAFVPNLAWRGVDPRDPNVRGARGWAPSTAVRLFRRLPGVRHEGRVHQSVAPSLRAAGGRIVPTDVPIHHYGHLRVDRAKGLFYVALTRQQAVDAPHDAAAWRDFGLALLSARGPVPALEAFRRAYALGGKTDAAFHIGRSLVGLGHAAAGLSRLDEALERARVAPSTFFDVADVEEERAGALEALGRLDEAEAAYREALRARPDSPHAENNLASLLAERGDGTTALSVIQGLVERYPGLAEPWATLGTVHLRRGETDAARRALRVALDIQPWYEAARANLAAAERTAGNAAAAARLWREVQTQHSELSLARAGIHVEDGHRPPGERDAEIPRGAVVSVIGHLAGGGGRVLVDVVRALRGRHPQAVFVGEGGNLHPEGLREELAALDVPVHGFLDRAQLAAHLAPAEPELCIEHWWSPLVGAPVRSAGEPWVAIGHAALPMPGGFDAYVTISAFHAQFQDHLPAERVHRIPNAVSLARFAPVTHGPRETVTIAVLTRLDPEKFPRRFLDFLPDLEALGARVLIAGRGPRRWEIEPEARARGLADRVRFLGPIDTAAVPTFLGQADIALHLTETHEEILSMTLLEMLAAGLPVVGEPKGCLPEIVRHGENGFVVSSETDVREALARLVRSPELRAGMGAASRERASRYAFDAFAERWRTLVEREGRTGRAGRGRASAAPSPIDLGSRPVASTWRASRGYVICATMRSGSNLLCEGLAQSGLAGAPGEHMRLLAPHIRAAAAPAARLREHLDALAWRTASANGVFGLKLLWHQLENLAGASGLGTGEGCRAARQMLEDAIPHARFIWLRRQDRLRQAISLYRARVSGEWSSGTTRPTPAPPPFDRDAILRAAGELAEADAAWARFFELGGIDPIGVAYEELAADYEGTVLRVLDELGIERPQLLLFGPRLLRRQADDASERWLARLAG